MKSDMVIDWKDVPAYLNTFHPTVDGRVTNIKLVPASITVISEKNVKNGQEVNIDILPLFKIGFENSSFSCTFVQDAAAARGTRKRHEDFEEEDEIFDADANTVQTILKHRFPQWISDVYTGTVLKLVITPIGTREDPYARFHIRHDELTYLPEDMDWVGDASENLEHFYLKTVGFDRIWINDGFEFLAQARRVKAT